MHGSRFFALLTVGLVACGGNYGRIAGPAAVDSLGIRSVTPAEPAIDTSNGVVYVSSEDTDIVILFALQGANLNPIGSIVVGIDAPVGMTVDASGKLYVANFGNGTVSVYPKGKVTPSLILSNGLIGPGDVAVRADGTVFVSNNQSTTVVAYHPGETKPFETLTGFGAPLGLAFDRAGNLFVGDERFGSTGCLWEVKHGSNHPKRLDLEIRYPIGVAVDSHENLYVTGETSQPEVAVYRLDQRKPVRVITSGLMSPFMIALTAQNALLAADNAAIDVVEYAFGQDVPEKTYSKDLKSPFGVAVLSPPTPGRQ